MALLYPSSRSAPSSLRRKGGCYVWTLLGANSSLLRARCHIVRCSTMASRRQKVVWVWTERREVMTAAVERGWNTFVFPGSGRELAKEWSSIALIHPLVIEGSDLFDGENERVASFYEISSPQQLEQLQPGEGQANNVVISLQGGWQVIPAENIVAVFQGYQKIVLAIATSYYEAQVFLEALEQGLGGVVLKVEDVGHILKLKDYFDRINEVTNMLTLTNVIVTQVQVVGMGDRVCVDLCSIMQPGEGLLEDPGSEASYSIFLQNAETVGLVCPCEEKKQKTSTPVTSLKSGDKVMLRVQGGARHTGIEIQEFILEK